MLGIPVPASTTRVDDTLGTYVPHLSLTCRAFGSPGAVLRPLGTMADIAEFGADVYQLRMAFADWPNTTEDMPVKQGDHLIVTSTGSDYPVRAVKVVPGSHLQIYVEVALPA